MLAAFRIFDRDHSSTISADELKYFISQLPEVGNVRIRYHFALETKL